MHQSSGLCDSKIMGRMKCMVDIVLVLVDLRAVESWKVEHGD